MIRERGVTYVDTLQCAYVIEVKGLMSEQDYACYFNLYAGQGTLNLVNQML